MKGKREGVMAGRIAGVLMTVACGKVAGTAGDAPQLPLGAVATQATVAIDDKELSPARLSEYRLLHRGLDQDVPLHAMTVVFSCAE